MKNLKDAKTKLFPSKTRRGNELSSSSALDSPSVISKLTTLSHAINPDMSQVIDDATSTMNDNYDETTSMLDTTVPLGEFLDEQLGRTRENETIETANMDESDDEDSPLDMNCLLCLRVMLWMKKLLETFLLATIGMILRNY